MTDYVTWIPEYYGHKPRYYRDGMLVKYKGQSYFEPLFWCKGDKYQVPREAVYGTIETAIADLHKRFTDDELKAAGVVLPVGRDWADELAGVYWNGSNPANKEQLSKLLRANCLPKDGI